MIKEFKDFLMRGNVVDLAVAVVIGGAFGAIITAFTEKIINPIIASFGGADAAGLGVQLRDGNEATFIDIGAVITATINFIMIAAVVYFILIVPMNKLAERRTKGQEPATQAPTEDVELLREIRDLLRIRQG